MESWGALVPKDETQAASFVKANPTYNGAGVVVAVLDTGVDPGAAGLQTTPEGKPKIIDIIDCTGSGDVDCSRKVKAKVGEDGTTNTIEGLTGRLLTLNPNWVNPSKIWRLGVKRGFELFPKRLISRVNEDAKKEWDKQHRACQAAALDALSNWKKSHSSSTVSPEELKEKQELEAREAELAALKFNNPGPIYDVIVWHDGTNWRAAVDVTETGNLVETKGLANYSVEHEYASFGDKIQLNYCITIYEDGSVCSICVDSGAHGTHVAGIIGAYRPDAPELNGMAPGCQIVSCKIGDTRLDAMETMPGVVRALADVVRLKCDLINMSFAESTSDANKGVFMRLADDVVRKHGVIFVSCAGNWGPGLSSAGAPAASSSSIFAVGACVTDAMMQACYAMQNSKTSGYQTNYTWTSVGPSVDGGLGPLVTAPGGAITCVPNWCLAKSQLMNGTSMSSPNCCGNLALLLSALKQENQLYTPHRIHTAARNTAKLLPKVSVYAQGNGLLQLEEAYKYVKKYADEPSEDTEFKVSVDDGRGIYLRNPSEKATSHVITVQPLFHEDAPKQDLIDFEMRIRLACDCDWVKLPEMLLCNASAKNFKVNVDPCNLTPGLHGTFIKGYDVTHSDRGPVFQIPVTVTKPVELNNNSYSCVCTLPPGTPHRTFLTPPDGATWVDVSVKLDNVEPTEDKVIIVLHTIQLQDRIRFTDSESKKYITLRKNQQEFVSRPIRGTDTIEICLAAYWNVTSTVTAQLEINFHGVVPSETPLTIASGDMFKQLSLSAPLERVSVNPTGSLDKAQTVIRPIKSSVSTLDKRHNLPDGKNLHELLMIYTFQSEEAGEIKIKFPGLNSKVYESEFLGSPFYFVMDSKNKILGYGDIYPENIKVPKGKVIVRAHLRHASIEQLNRNKNMIAVIERKLSKAISLNFYKDYTSVMNKGSKFGKRVLEHKTNTAIFVEEPDTTGLPKTVKPGDVLRGTVTYAAPNERLMGQPGGFPVLYMVPPSPNKEDEPKKEAKDKSTALEKMNNAIRDLIVSKLNDAAGTASFQDMYNKALSEYPKHLPLLQTNLTHLSSNVVRDNRVEDLIKAADSVIALIDTDELATHFGTNIDEDDMSAVQVRKDMTAKKTALIDALSKRTRALGLQGSDVSDKGATFESSLKELQKWDTVDYKSHMKLKLEDDSRKGRHGSILKAIRAQESNNDGPLDDELMKYRMGALKSLGWGHVHTSEHKWNLINRPVGIPRY
eukprot:m.71341 g.71341  ORF g.71341 m.71341 type:complete len:1235 (+) comp12238_c0_seq1:40-3744(+)